MKKTVVGLALVFCVLGASCNLPVRAAAAQAVAADVDGSPALVRTGATPTAMVQPTPEVLSSPAGQPYDLLIVTPREFLDPMRRLADWKNSTGMPAGILVLEEIEQFCKGRDFQETIKQCLALYQQKSGILYAMLVGDGDRFPVRWIAADIVGPTVGNIAYYPADLYYADLYKADGSFDTWDGNNNGLFGEIGGEIRPGPINIDNVDLNPDIAVGRVPVSTLEEATTYVDKVIRYETNAFQSDWAHKLLAITSGGYMADDCRREEEVLTLIPADWPISRFYYDGNPCQATPALTADNVIAALNAGAGLVSYIGHGDIDVWFGALTVKDFARLENADKPSVIFSGGCGTASFTAGPPGGPYTDVSGVHHAGGGDGGEVFDGTPPQPAALQIQDAVDGMMEYSLVQSPSGAVVYIGAVTGSQFPAQFDVNRYFFEGIVTAGPQAGDAWNYAIRKYYQTHTFQAEYQNADWYILADFHQVWKFMLFGDPSLRIGGVAHS